jgi:hypothetical protein
VGIGSRRVSSRQARLRRRSESGFVEATLRMRLGGAFLAVFFALAPSTVPDWRSDPGIRTVAVLPIGEPVTSIDRPQGR